jgi:hypothetical protein
MSLQEARHDRMLGSFKRGKSNGRDDNQQAEVRGTQAGSNGTGDDARGDLGLGSRAVHQGQLVVNKAVSRRPARENSGGLFVARYLGHVLPAIPVDFTGTPGSNSVRREKQGSGGKEW